MDPRTIEILKQFSTINQGIVIEAGNKIRTMAVTKNIFASAVVPDTFEREFAIYNLNEFLAVLSLFGVPDFTYGEESVSIKQGKMKARYNYSSPAVVTAPPKGKTIPVRDVQLEFDVTAEELRNLMKAAAVLKATDLVFSKTGIRAFNKKMDANDYALSIDGVEGDSDKLFSLKLDSMKMLPGDYRVRVTDTVVAFDAGEEGVDALSYTMALERD